MSPSTIEIDIWRAEIRQLQERVKNSEVITNLTAFYGSSSIRLWETLSEDLFPHPVINLGFGGSSYYWCNHFHSEVFNNLYPDRVILYAGDNDLGTETPEDEILKNLTSLINKIKMHHKKTKLTIISVKPSPDRHYLRSNIESLNDQMRNLMLEYNGDFIDLYSKMLNLNGSYRPELFLEDQLHMNELGYKIWQEEILTHLNDLES